MRLANAYLAAGDLAKAKEVANKCLAVMPDTGRPLRLLRAPTGAGALRGGRKGQGQRHPGPAHDP
ncbi:MAG: hypothetical protein WKG07_10040 [Hymenobacter sp.]